MVQRGGSQSWPLTEPGEGVDNKSSLGQVGVGSLAFLEIWGSIQLGPNLVPASGPLSSVHTGLGLAHK